MKKNECYVSQHNVSKLLYFYGDCLLLVPFKLAAIATKASIEDYYNNLKVVSDKDHSKAVRDLVNHKESLVEVNYIN